MVDGLPRYAELDVTNLDRQAALRHAEESARSVAPLLRAGFGNPGVVGHKSEYGTDVVTEYDRPVEDQLFVALSAYDRSWGFHGEERGRRRRSRTFWLTDGLDGSGYLLRGWPFCTTMIALVHDGRVEVAAIYDFMADKMYSAVRRWWRFL